MTRQRAIAPAFVLAIFCGVASPRVFALEPVTCTFTEDSLSIDGRSDEFSIARRDPGGKGWSSTGRFDAAVPEDGTCALHRLESLQPLVFAAAPDPRPYGISRLPPAPDHHVRGSPDPPLPYVVELAFPRAGLKNVIGVFPQPGSDRLLFISDTFGVEASRIRRLPDRGDATPEDIETLLDDAHATRHNVVHYAIAFHPRFAENGFVYVGCNGGARKDAATDADRSEPRKTRVLRYRMDPRPPWRLDPASETEVIAWESDPTQRHHFRPPRAAVFNSRQHHEHPGGRGGSGDARLLRGEQFARCADDQRHDRPGRSLHQRHAAVHRRDG